MTKRDYEIIATALAQAIAESSKGRYSGDKTAKAIAEHIEHAFHVDNHKFDPQKFRKFTYKKWRELI